MRFDLPTMDEIRSPGGESAAGVPMQLPIADIDEDPQQPRQEFDQQSLLELAATIAGRGVRQPVSVRRHPECPGRWILNFGARRLRAARLARESTIAAFEDATADSYDQVIENEQREGLKPLEIALFVKRRLDQGESQADIARRLGKSQPYITYACSLIDAPDWLLDLYRSGKCRGMFELHELRRLHAIDAGAVEAAVAEAAHFGRAELKLLKARVTVGPVGGSHGRHPGAGDESAVATSSAVASLDRHLKQRQTAPAGVPSLPKEDASAREVLERLDVPDSGCAVRHAELGQRVVLRATHEGARARVVLDELPDVPASVWLVSDDGSLTVAAISAVDGLRLVIEPARSDV
jgi:ParB family chromosome partitioning protein